MSEVGGREGLGVGGGAQLGSIKELKPEGGGQGQGSGWGENVNIV